MLKKLLTYTLVITTMVWSVGLLATPLVVGAASSGNLIKLQCATGASVNDACRAVYYLGADGKRYVFPNEKTFKTWYSDFSGVMVVSSTEMSSYPIGGNVTYKPGVKLVKITTDPKVYAVGANGSLMWVTTGDIAAAIYGATWNKMVEDVSDAFFVNYSIGSNINVAGDYNKQAVMDAATSINVDKKLSGSTTTGPVSTGTSLTVALASDTPATGVVVNGAAQVPFTKVSLTASADGDIVIDSWEVQRMGLAQDSAFSSLDLLDGATMLPINENGKNLNSSHVANFTEDFVVKAGTTRTVYIAANMVSNLQSNSGETPSLALSKITLKGSAAVVGSLPINGNYQNINSTISIGSATVTRGAYTNATNTALEVGRTGYAMFAFSVAAGSAEDVSISRVRIYQAGSASLSNDLGNLKLYRDGTELATGVVNGNYVSFTFNGLTIPKGQTFQFQVKGDVTGGSARTILLEIYRTTDLLVKGLQYNFNITPSYTNTSGSIGATNLIGTTATISTGTLRIGRSSSVSAGNITVGSNQVLGALEFEAKGEPAQVTALTLTVASSTSGTIVEDALQSVKLVDSNGNTVAGPTDVTNNALTVAFTDSFTVPVGISHYKVVGNLTNNGGWTTNDTITVSLTPSSAVTTRGDVTGQTITASPASSVSVSTQTLKTANLVVSKHSKAVARNVITNSQNVLANSWVFDATNSGEDVRITTLAVRASTTGKINALTLRQGASTDCTGTVMYPVNDAPVSSNDANTTSTFALSTPLVVTKGTSVVVDLCGNVGSNNLAGEVNTFGLTDSSASITATGVTTGNTASVTLTANDGPALTSTAGGTLAVTLDASAASTGQAVAGTTGLAMTDVRFKATNESIDITKLILRVADGGLSGTAAGDYTLVSKVLLKVDGVVVGNPAGYILGGATFQVNLDRGALTIPEGSVGKKLSVIGDTAAIGTNLPGIANADIAVGLNGANGFTATGNGSNAAATITYNSSTGSSVILHKSMPQVVQETPANKLGATAVLDRVKITAVGDKVAIARLSFVTTTSTGVDLSNGYYRLASCSGCDGIANGETLTSTQSAGTDISSGGVKAWSNTISTGPSHGKSYLGIAAGVTATVDFYATVAVTANADSVSTSVLGDTATTTNDTGGSEAAAYFTTGDQGGLVWSDLNLDDSNSSASLSSKQWYNGYYVSGLGPNATSTPVTVGE